VSRHLEEIGQNVAYDAGDLRRHGQGQRTTPAIVFRKTCPVLDGDRCFAVEPETVFPEIGPLPMQMVNHTDVVLKILEPIWETRTR